MLLKFIVSIGVKPHNDTTDSFHELALSKGTGRLGFSSKTDDNGHYWITKVTATLLHDDELLHEPCIMRVELMDCYYIIGTADIPVFPAVNEEVLTGLTVEHKSKWKPLPLGTSY
jgi:hypothetical protein